MKKHNLPNGHALAHGDAHDDHHLASRRRFLRNMGLISGGTMLVPGTAIQALGSNSLVSALLDNPGDRILVLIRLKGGNDGLNTIIPIYDYSTYANARPGIRWEAGQYRNLTNELGLPNIMSGAGNLWDAGAMKVVNAVGYPDHNLSHFRSSDILASASDANENITSGWLGRHLDTCFPDFLTDPPTTPPAIQIGDFGSITFNNDENVSLSVNVSNVNELFEIAQNGELYDTTNLPDCFYGEQLGYLRSVANSTFLYADEIKDAYDASSNAVSYPTNAGLGAQLALVARLIKGNLGTQLYLVTMDGFDNHANQRSAHDNLLQHLSDAVSAFYQDLAQADKDQQTLAVSFSEFGRRIEQNASQGTDHGTSAPMLLFGPALEGNGAIGQTADLDAPNPDGNLEFHTDFRSVYATLLEKWLCIPTGQVEQILGDSWNTLDLGFDCNAVSTYQPTPTIAVQLRNKGPRQWALHFSSAGGVATLELYSMSGQRLGAIKAFVPRGEAHLSFDQLAGDYRGASAYRFTINGKVASGVVPMF